MGNVCMQKEPILDQFSKIYDRNANGIEHPLQTHTHTRAASNWGDFTERTMHTLLQIYVYRYLFYFYKSLLVRGNSNEKGLCSVHWIWWRTLPFGWTQVDDGITVPSLAVVLATWKRFGQIFPLPHRNPIRTVNYCQYGTFSIQFVLFVVLIWSVHVWSCVSSVVVFNNNNLLIFCLSHRSIVVAVSLKLHSGECSQAVWTWNLRCGHMQMNISLVART